MNQKCSLIHTSYIHISYIPVLYIFPLYYIRVPYIRVSYISVPYIPLLGGLVHQKLICDGGKVSLFPFHTVTIPRQGKPVMENMPV